MAVSPEAVKLAWRILPKLVAGHCCDTTDPDDVRDAHCLGAALENAFAYGRTGSSLEALLADLQAGLL